MRKGTAIPYISHLMSVAALVPGHGGNEDQAIAGLLHDAPEDQGGQAAKSYEPGGDQSPAGQPTQAAPAPAGGPTQGSSKDAPQ